MPNQLTIVLSGRKQSGKNSACDYIANKFAEMMRQYDQMHKQGQTQPYFKIYSFADTLKSVCKTVFGASHEQVYGTDEQKNSLIPHCLWDNLPEQWRWEGEILNSGPMSARKLMQVFGTEMVRGIYHDAWAASTYNLISQEGYALALLADGRFPNEMRLGKKSGLNVKTIRLLRAIAEDTHASETALDNFPVEEFDLVVDNREMNLEETLKHMTPTIDKWLEDCVPTV